jgi:hypothetical protein
MASESTQQIRTRDQVFISYSHKDHEWTDRPYASESGRA